MWSTLSWQTRQARWSSVSNEHSAMIETTDAASGTGTTYTLGVGETAQGHVGVLGDSDWYRVNLVAGHTYTFALAGEGATTNKLQDPCLYVRNNAGGLLVSNDDSGPGSYSSPTYTAASTGTYYLDAQASITAAPDNTAFPSLRGRKQTTTPIWAPARSSCQTHRGASRLVAARP